MAGEFKMINEIMLLVKSKWKYIVLAIILVAGIYFYHDAQERRYKQAVVMSQQQLQIIDDIQKRLHMSEQNAQALQEALKKIEAGRVQPVTNYYVQAPTIQAAAEKVQDQIKRNDSALPSPVLEKTDRTVVTPNTDKQKVDVYKINLDKRWEISTGVGYHKDWYMPVEVQRNVGRNKAVSVEIHLQPEGVAGGELKTTLRF